MDAPISPRTLEPILGDRAPDNLLGDTPYAGRALCKLDAECRQHLPPEVVRELSSLVVERVASRLHQASAHPLPLPEMPAGIELGDLHLQQRTINCLQRAELPERLDEWREMTVGDLLALPTFGAKCLVDLLTAMEAVQAESGCPDATMLAFLDQIEQIPDATDIPFSDPRMDRLLRGLDHRSETIGELINRLRQPTAIVANRRAMTSRLDEIRRTLEAFRRLPLEEELSGIFLSRVKPRDREIVVQYLGWDGRDGRTLEELGGQYGLSRERIRQVCLRALSRTHDTPVFAPTLDRTLELIERSLPCPATELKGLLQEQGLSQTGISPGPIAQAAERLRRNVNYRVVDLEDGEIVVAPKHAELPQGLAQAARKAIGSFGVANVARVRSRATEILGRERIPAELLTATLSVLDGFQWLDRRQTWFRLASLPQYGLPNLISKVLAIVPSIEVSALRAAVARYRRSQHRLPPVGALKAYCKTLPWARVEGNTVYGDPEMNFSESLSDVERTLIDLLHKHGPIMERNEFKDLASEHGINRFSFNAAAMGSPVIAQLGRSVYALLGAPGSQQAVRRALSRAPRNKGQRVLVSAGHTDDGTPFARYKLSGAVISGGVITIPAALRREVVGGFTLRDSAGNDQGRLVSNGLCGWGVGPALRSTDTQPGTAMLLLFDLDAREAHLRLGDEVEEADEGGQG